MFQAIKLLECNEETKRNNTVVHTNKKKWLWFKSKHKIKANSYYNA